MIRASSHFAWPWLTLSWLAESPDTTLSVGAALRRAQDDLEKRGATVEIALKGDRLQFKKSWRAGRSWLEVVADGAVYIDRDAERVVVTAEACLWPLAVWTVPLTVLLMATRSSIFLILSIPLYVAWTALAAYNGLRDVVLATLTLDPPRRAA